MKTETTTELSDLLQAVYRGLRQLYQNLAAELAVPMSQLVLLENLWGGDGKSVKELGQAAGLTASSVTTLLDRLEDAGLVRRERESADRRVVRVFVTEKGDELRRRKESRGLSFRQRVNAVLEGCLAPEDLEEFGRVLKQLAVGLPVKGGAVNPITNFLNESDERMTQDSRVDGRVPAVPGVVLDGQGEARAFISIPWVRAALGMALGTEPYPGTLNIRTDAPRNLAALREASGYRLRAEEEGFCDATLVPVHLRAAGGRLQGLLLVPHVPGYSEHLAEIVAPVHLRRALGLSDGDMVVLELDDQPAGRPARPARNSRSRTGRRGDGGNQQ